MSAWEFLRGLPHLWSRERFGYASASEKKRWLLNSALMVNGERVAWDEQMDFPLMCVVLFPSGNRVTLL